MCLPLAAAGLLLSVASTAASVYAQNENVKVQNKANQVQYDNAMTAQRTNMANLEVQRNQAAQDASQQINMNNAAARSAMSTAAVSAGESGVSGTSVAALLRDLAGKAAMDNTNVEANYLRRDAAINASRENVSNATASQINSLQTPQGVDYLGAGLRLAGGVYDYKTASTRQQDIAAGRRG